jgi:hypothetical protein
VVRAPAQHPPLTGITRQPPVHHPAERTFPEVEMRIGTVLLLVWLVIGAIAGGQRHYYTSSNPDCARASTIAVTILAGPLNFIGANPKVTCRSSN